MGKTMARAKHEFEEAGGRGEETGKEDKGKRVYIDKRLGKTRRKGLGGARGGKWKIVYERKRGPGDEGTRARYGAGTCQLWFAGLIYFVCFIDIVNAQE